MSKFYGTVEGQANTCGTRRGGKYIKVSAQSWDGSVITSLRYDDENNLKASISIGHGSTTWGDEPLGEYTLDELREMAEMYKKAKGV